MAPSSAIIVPERSDYLIDACLSLYFLGKYVTFKTGELLIRSVELEDSDLQARCEVKNRVTNETALSAVFGKLTVIGKCYYCGQGVKKVCFS